MLRSLPNYALLNMQVNKEYSTDFIHFFDEGENAFESQAAHSMTCVYGIDTVTANFA